MIPILASLKLTISSISSNTLIIKTVLDLCYYIKFRFAIHGMLLSVNLIKLLMEACTIAGMQIVIKS